MTVLMIPELEEEGERWPTLGPLVVAWIEENLVFGPGDLQGERAVVDAEKRAFISRFYEIYPAGSKDAMGKLIEGRRRFRRCCLSLQKGSAKTELAAWIAAAELHPDGPVRFGGWDEDGEPIGVGVRSAYVPMVAYTEEQTTDLAYAALKTMLSDENCRVRGDFDIGEERIFELRYRGKAVALAGAPNARDGARTTFAIKDETHRWETGRLRAAHETMLANLPKRLLADPWELETTTAYSPGRGSVAEDTAAYARAVAEGKIKDSRLFYFHRQARDGYDLGKVKDLRLAVTESAGAVGSKWKDIEGIVSLWQNPKADKAYLERVWLNRPVAQEAQAFNMTAWAAAKVEGWTPTPGAQIVTGFDGSLKEDSTAYVGMDLVSGVMWPIRVWEKPLGGGEEWEVDRADVDAVVRATHETFKVWRMLADPAMWHSELAAWQGRYGDKVVIAWPTSMINRTALELAAFATAIEKGEVKSAGGEMCAVLDRHLGNAQRSDLPPMQDGTARWLMVKRAREYKIDAGYAGLLAWIAYRMAVASGVLDAPPEEPAGVWSGLVGRGS